MISRLVVKREVLRAWNNYTRWYNWPSIDPHKYTNMQMYGFLFNELSSLLKTKKDPKWGYVHYLDI